MRAHACIVLFLLASCGSAPPAQPEPSNPIAATPPADTSKAEAERAKQLEQLAAAERDHAANPRDEDNIIWLGRRLAYLERFDEAQEVYTRGLELHPQSWKILRHRGHRWITLRKFDRALEDLALAWKLCDLTLDEVEPDGQPNAAGIPIGTYHSNIVYHLALAHYLRGEWREACSIWTQGRTLNAANDDRLCSSTYWNYLALRRDGQHAVAEALIGGLRSPLKVVENESYQLLCLLFRGERTPEQVLEGRQPGSIDFATLAYGIACWQRFRGDERAARELLEKIVASGPRNAFGFIAAEVDLARAAPPATGLRGS